MKLGLHISNFTWPGGAGRLGPKLAEVARLAEETGFERISVMDHLWQISPLGPPEHEMLEAYTTLGFLAAQTQRASLMTVVTGCTYRSPGMLAKIVSTLDVLSGGRAWLGIGAAWNEEEARGLGLDFPPLGERYERLEEIIQICLQMWSGDDRPFEGKHYKLGRTLNSPQPLSRPHPPVLIGGAGERKTLRLVARYAQACNIFAMADVAHKFQVLREHCEAEGRSYDEVEKTVQYNFDIGERGEKASKIVDDISRFASLGAAAVMGSVARVEDLKPLELIGEHVIPAVAKL
jgi:F420-dependent oxidoreductase-like protein